MSQSRDWCFLANSGHTGLSRSWLGESGNALCSCTVFPSIVLFLEWPDRRYGHLHTILVLVGYDNFLMVSIPQAYGQYCLIKSYAAMNKPEDPVLGHMMHVQSEAKEEWLGHMDSCFVRCLYRTQCSVNALCLDSMHIHLCSSTHRGCWCTTIIPNTPVQKMGEETTQPMTSGKNELQDHLIFISEKALHKRYFSFCQTSWSISWVYGMAYNLFLLNFMVLGDCNSRVSLCPTFSP